MSRKPYEPIEFDAKGSVPATAAAIPSRTPASRPALPMPRPQGQEPAMDPQESPPAVTPVPMRERIVTAIGAPFRVVTGGPIDLAVAYAVLYILLFVLFMALFSWGCTSVYTIGHGWFGLFGCPRETLVVQPVETTRKDLLKQGEQ